jgi:hypothetical protein
MYSISHNKQKNNILVTNYLMMVTLQDMRGFLNVNFQNGILNIYQRILIETKMKQLLI